MSEAPVESSSNTSCSAAQETEAEEALDYIVRSRGRHFDPQVVDAFLRVLDRLGKDGEKN